MGKNRIGSKCDQTQGWRLKLKSISQLIEEVCKVVPSLKNASSEEGKKENFLNPTGGSTATLKK